MAGLQPLTALIYLERQQPGSMLCAQHALNNLFRAFSMHLITLGTFLIERYAEGNYVNSWTTMICIHLWR